MNAWDLAIWGPILGTSAQVVSSALQLYTTFKRSNVERYYGGLLESGKDLSAISKSEDLQRQVLAIMDKVANEPRQEKIDRWRNATIHMATNFKNQHIDVTENYLQALDGLTVLDLMVLSEIYTVNLSGDSDDFAQKIFIPFSDRGFAKPLVEQSIQKLEMFNFVTVDRSNKEHLLTSGRNSLGNSFLTFISDKF